MLLFVGLGNKGNEYLNTRHNAGFLALDLLAKYLELPQNEILKFQSSIFSLDFQNQKILCLKPQTYMNLSGRAVLQAMQFYKIAIEDIFVFHDDIDIECGKIKFKIGGGAGGHNGLKSLDETIGKNYTRIRIGVGRPEFKDDVSDFVLSNFKKDEWIATEESVCKITIFDCKKLFSYHIKFMNNFCDVVIIGAGGSGLSLAIKLKRAGITSVAVISKVSVMGSHTTAAKGGINASLSSITEDKPEWHSFDTLTSSNHLGDPARIDFMCKRAPQEIEFLENEGVKFDKLENGKIAQRRYGGQKTHFGSGDFAFRSCFVADSTGFEIMQNLHKSALDLKIDIYEFHFVFDAQKNTIFALDLKTGNFVNFNFKILVFAGGGFSQNFLTNSSSNALTGDCHTLALKLGGELEDMEFVQFHPTGLYKKGILISEAVRAEGGILLNSKGERFMQKYSPNFLELASRDVVARAIFEEGNGANPCFLSLKKIPPEVINAKLKGTVQTAKFFAGIDVFKEDIPVFPTAHYNMGGIKVDENYRIKEDIFAIGECAGARIHGANRLGCNSLLELFTSSTLVFEAIKKDLSKIANQET